MVAIKSMYAGLHSFIHSAVFAHLLPPDVKLTEVSETVAGAAVLELTA